MLGASLWLECSRNFAVAAFAAELFQFAMATLLTVLGLSALWALFIGTARWPLRPFLGCANSDLQFFRSGAKRFFSFFPPVLAAIVLTAAIHFIKFYLKPRPGAGRIQP
jgi:hypothetical protein